MTNPILAVLVIAATMLQIAGCALTPTKFEQADALRAQYKAEATAAWASPEFAPLQDKTALWDNDITPSMTLNPDAATSEERQAALKWADRLSALQRIQLRAASLNVPPGWEFFFMPPLEAYAKRDLDLVISLHQNKVTWGQFNAQRIENSENLKRKMEMGLAVMGGSAPAARSGPSPIELYLLTQPPIQDAPRAPVTCTYVNGSYVCY